MNPLNRKRLLIFNDGLELGGTEKLLVALLNHLVQKKCQITLLLPEESEKNVLLPAISEKVEVVYLYPEPISRLKRKWGEIRMIFKTASFLKKKYISEKEYDEVICFKEGFYAKMFADFTIPKTLWLHNVFYQREYEVRSLKERFAVWLNKKQIREVYTSYINYDRVISVSEACKKSYIDVVFGGCLPIQDIRVLPNGVDTNAILAHSKEPIELGIDEEKINFTLLTRVSPDKRIDRIINASKRLKEEGYSNFVVHLIGVGRDDEEVGGEIERLKLSDVLILHGSISNPYHYLVKSDWVICVSERESFSLALLEGMVLGIPVITTNCGGPVNLIENGKLGLLVDNSTEGVYLGMKKILGDDSLKEKYAATLKNITERYDLKNWLIAIDKLLRV